MPEPQPDTEKPGTAADEAGIVDPQAVVLEELEEMEDAEDESG